MTQPSTRHFPSFWSRSRRSLDWFSGGAQAVADVIESLLWEDCYVDELQAVAHESDYAGLAFMDWFQRAVARRK